MKLGEALTMRARMSQRLSELQSRVLTNLLIQEGDENPSEDPDGLRLEFVDLSNDLAALVVRIGRTNATTLVISEQGNTLLELLQRREHLIRLRGLRRAAANGATVNASSYRFTRNEVKFEPTIDIEEYRSAEDTLTAKINDLDIQIQTLNWSTDLVD